MVVSADLLVELIMRAQIWFGPSLRSFRTSFSGVGITKVSVFLDPVTASATTSLCRMESGIVAAWMGRPLEAGSRFGANPDLWNRNWVELSGGAEDYDVALTTADVAFIARINSFSFAGQTSSAIQGVAIVIVPVKGANSRGLADTSVSFRTSSVVFPSEIERLQE